MPPKNVLVAQSGGPSAVINNSLRGVVEACFDYPETFGTIYAGYHGIEGVLKEELLDLSAQSRDEISLLRNTPGAGAIGTCRYKIKSHMQEDFDRVVDVLRAHDIGYFFYNGGNDSMDTAHKVSELARKRGLDVVGVGVPKTIDNDVGDSEFKLVDHTPGYGSTARYWANMVQGANEENRGSSPADPVLVMQAMGRKIGFIPAAARLGDPNREMPLLILMRESGLSMEQVADAVNDMLRTRGRCVIVTGEGFDVGDIGERKDSFGHAMFGASQLTVQQAMVNYLNDAGLAAKGSARGNVPGTEQRHNMIYASTVDLEEAYRSGRYAVKIARTDGSGWMSTILRAPGEIYSAVYDKVPLKEVANSERCFPAEWLADSKTDVTDAFVNYARPLIGEDWPSVPLVNGLQRFTRFEKLFADTKLPAYTPQGDRE